MNDLVLIVPDNSDKAVVGRLILCLAEDEVGSKWVVYVVDENGYSKTYRAWDSEMRLHARSDFDPALEIKFVVWDALHSSKNWDKVSCTDE
jgi:hypothetical protein